MRNRTIRLLAFVLIFVLMIGYYVPSVAAAGENTSSLGTLLDSFVPNDSVFTLTSTSRLYVVSEVEPSGDFLQTTQLIQQQFSAAGYELRFVWGPADYAESGDILIQLVTNAALGEEGYRLQVTDHVVISAANVDGLIYGSNMLLKHIRNGGTSIQGFTAQDVPDTRQRVVSLDCGRKYYTKDWICNFIRQMSWMGYNTLQLHFSDDSGFRFDLWDPAYYKGEFQPKNDFSWLCGSEYTSWTLSAYQKDPDKGKRLSTADVVEILETAKEYHIEVIPSYDSPAHLDYTTWMYEKNYQAHNDYSFYSTYYNKTFYAKDVNGIINYAGTSGHETPLQWPYYAAINIKDEQAKAFIFELYIDIANFFKEYAGSDDFSIGADEVNLTSLSPKWGYSDFVSYINELNTLLNNKGYTMRMYNDFIGSTDDNASSYDYADNIQIMYWDSPFNPSSQSATNHTESPSYYVNKGMTLYNCIQTHTYYALRITSGGSDARSEHNRQWTFYHATEEKIYNEWYPGDFREVGDYAESSQVVPDANLGGAYYLIWGDYACVSTEAEIWNGVYDKTSQNTGEFYSLIDRMWSNTIKMWNWDINRTVSYNSYAALRADFGYFPGFTACSTATVLPDAIMPTRTYRADHTALAAALANKVPSANYTTKSYITYQKAYDAAFALNADPDATAEQIAAALLDLENARKGLVPVSAVVTILCKTNVGGTETTIKSLSYALVVNNYRFYVPPLTGYTFTSCSGAVFTPLPSNDGSGYISGSSAGAVTITLWYANTPYTGYLNHMIQNAITDPGSYTAESWSRYQTALNRAKSISVSNAATQADINNVMTDLQDAQNNLVISGGDTSILSISALTPTAYLGKQVALRITTTPNVANLSVTSDTGEEDLTLCVGKVQNLNNGETVKIWLVYFPADEAGSFTYTICADSATDTISIKVQ